MNEPDARQDEDADRDRSAGEAKHDDTPALEWIIGAIGFILVSASIGFMLYQAVVGDSSPPDVAVHMESVTPTQGGYLLQFRASNRGGSAAGGVVVRGELRAGDGAAETSETTLDYVPSQSEREGGLFFAAIRGNSRCVCARSAMKSLE